MQKFYKFRFWRRGRHKKGIVLAGDLRYKQMGKQGLSLKKNRTILI